MPEATPQARLEAAPLDVERSVAAPRHDTPEARTVEVTSAAADAAPLTSAGSGHSGFGEQADLTRQDQRDAQGVPVSGPAHRVESQAELTRDDRDEAQLEPTVRSNAPTEPLGAAATPVESLGAPAAPLAAAHPVAQPMAEARPAEVVSQIAQQVDLYRLPSGKGVRIQLNPDGLGGVEVTVRYGARGAVELHLSIEQGATASLVEAGWGELRDALALQGITADRLVMSVTSPAGSSPSDQGANGGARSDGGQTTFGQQGQHRDHQNNDARPHRSWSAPFTPPTEAEDAPAVASSARIDYRA
jgi:flagellar hook-length control protein FliK